MQTFKPLVIDNDLYGENILRLDATGVPAAFRATITHTNRLSANKANSNQTIEVKYPLVTVVDGRNVSLDAWKATFKFSALQHVVNEGTADLAIDALIAYITENRAAIIEGSKRSSTEDFVFGA